MQVKKIAVACALACAALAGSANAALSQDVIDDLNTANAAGHVVFISGASAVQKGFTDIVASMFDGNVTYFADSAADVRGTNYVGVLGTLKSDEFSGEWAGEKAVVIYRVTGGSVYGVDPVARNEPIPALNVSSSACGSSGTGTSVLPYVCTLNSQRPDAGVSDVAPKFFKKPYNTEGEVAANELSEEELAELETIPLYGLAFGIPVTKTVAAGAVLDKGTVAAIMSGGLTSWKGVQGETSGNMVICRRTPGSGTQAVMNMWAGNFPCTNSYNIPADRSKSPTVWNDATNTYNISQGTTDKLVVIENASSGDVRKCLDKAVTGGSYTTKDRSNATVTVNFSGSGHKAIGVLSMDSLANSVVTAKSTEAGKATGNWQFRPLNGAGTYTWDDTEKDPVASTNTGLYPTLANYENGMWDMQGWISFNIPARTTDNEPAKRELLDYFVSKAQNPAVLQGISDLKKVAAAIPGNGYTGSQVLDAKFLGGDQCAPYNRTAND